MVSASTLQIPVEPTAGRDPQTGFLRCAAEIAAELRRRAVTLSDGSVTWLSPPRPHLEAETASALGPHVYDGFCGIALFLAAHYEVSGDPASLEVALAATASLRQRLRDLVRDSRRASCLRLGIGGLSGLGGFLYTLVGLARSLAEPELWREAGELTALFTPERIAADRQHDVVSGSAGALLALLALERHAPSSLGVGQRCLDLADRCAERLLAARTSWRGGPRAWPGEAHPPLSGFAHGAAGIGHALLQLHHRTGRERLRTAALEGFAFERSLYDPRAGNWIDPRSGRLLEQSAWCHGAPGIALGRAASLMATDDPEVRCDLEEALRLTLALPDSPRDHLCCGNAGRIGVLLAAHRALGRPELMQAARALARRRLDRAEEQGGFAFGEPGPLSLFWGMAGVGFTLLRLDREDDLPCPLLLE